MSRYIRYRVAHGSVFWFSVLACPLMAVRRLVILAAAAFLLFAPRPAFPDTTYTVGKGDTLSGISKRLHVPEKRIRAANGLRSARIQAGMKLRIPGKAVAKGPEKAVAKRREKAPAQVHTVRKGETLRSISRRYDVPEAQLRRENSLKKGGRIRAGSRIVVRRELPATVLVRKDDTLSGIARRFGLTARELAEWNELDGGVLVPDQELALAPPEKAPGETGPALAAEVPLLTSEELRDAAAAQVPADEDAADPISHRIARVAKKMLSVPYMWGGTSLRGIDCSGYVQMVFRYLNLELPRSAREQFEIGRQVEKESLSVGDLVFFRTYAPFPSHVGIYLGDNRFIHASSGGRGVNITAMDHPYYEKRFIGARRLLFKPNDEVN